MNASPSQRCSAPIARQPAAGRRRAGPGRQRGLTFWGLVVVAALVAFFILLGMRCVPVYLNHMKVANAVDRVATDPELAGASSRELLRGLQRYWDIERIQHLDPRDVLVQRGEGNLRLLSYAYEARVPFIANIDLLFYFEDEVPVGPEAP